MVKRSLVLIALGAVIGCAESTAPPSPLYPGYFLSTVDGKPLPVPLSDDGVMLMANTLVFDAPNRPRAGMAVDGMVRYILDVRRPDQSLEHSEIDLNYQVREDELRIDLCPPLALCIAETVLVGTITGRTDPLVLTHYLGGRPGSEYRYFPALPD